MLVIVKGSEVDEREMKMGLQAKTVGGEEQCSLYRLSLGAGIMNNYFLYNISMVQFSSNV